MLKVISWNINSVRVRLERLLKFLKNEKPELVCLQEIKALEERFPFEALAELGFHTSVYGQSGYNGVAILSRVQPTNTVLGFGNILHDQQARVIRCTVAGIEFISAYAPNGQAVGSDKFEYKLQWFQAMREYLSEVLAANPRVIICGDFNVAPTDQDVYDPELWKEQVLCSTPERAALSSLLELGFIDTFRLLNPDSAEYSWWDYRHLSFPMNHGLRIDYCFCSEAISQTCREAKILREERKGHQPSDHAPVSAIFDLDIYYN